MMDLSKILKDSNICISSVKVIAKDRRDDERYVDVTYVAGELNKALIMRELDRYGYDLVSAEVIETVHGELSLKNLFEAFEIAGEEK